MNGCVCRLHLFSTCIAFICAGSCCDPVVRFSRQVPKAEFLYVVPDGRGDFFALGRSNDPALPRFTQRCSDQAELRLMPGICVLRRCGRQVSGIGWRDDCRHLYRWDWRRNPTSIALDPSGFVYIAGSTTSRNLPTTEGVVQKQPTSGASPTGFVVKLTNDLTSVWFSTYLGGAATTRVTAVAADYLGNAYLTGVTDARDFPTSGGAFRTTSAAGMAFFTKLSARGTTYIGSTFLGVGNSRRDRVRYQWRRMGSRV